MTPLFVLTIILSILFCGITLDLGMVERTRLRMQNAADAAALGAQVSHDQEDPNWLNNAMLDASQNGYTNGGEGGTVSVKVMEQPTSGGYAGDYDAVQVTITKTMNTVFMGSLNGGKTTMTVSAVSLLTPCVYLTGAHSPGVTYPLSLQTGSSIGYSGGSTLGCTLYVNRGAYVNGDSSLWSNATSIVGSAGGSSIAGADFHPPRYNATAQADPLSYNAACTTLNSNCIHATSTGVLTPGFSSCSYTGRTWATGTTLSPGTYCGSFNFTNETVTLSPGLYIVTGGATWTNSIVNGAGVTLYFTQKGDGKYGQVIVNGCTLYISAPSTSANGGIPTILFMNDPKWVQTATEDFQFQNGTNSYGDGIFYLIGTGLQIDHSTLSATHYLAFDLDHLAIISSALVPKSNFSTVPTGDPFTPLGGLVQ